MAENIDILQLRFEGNGINPEKVKPSQVCDLVINLQNALLATIKKEYPEIDVETVLFSLDGIKHESLGINLKALKEKLLPQVYDAVIGSFLLIATCVGTNDVSKLSSIAVQSIKKIAAFSKENGCNGQFNHNGKTISTITPTTEIKEIKIPSLKSSVNIYGEIIDVGSNIHVKLDDGNTVIVDTDKATSKQLAPRLWDYVGLRGIAKWDIETFKITEFKLTEVLDYNPGSISDAFNELKSSGNSGWDNFNNNDDIAKQLFRD